MMVAAHAQLAGSAALAAVELAPAIVVTGLLNHAKSVIQQILAVIRHATL
jgi:hypothetical protein